ncbi:restriction endonuclease subunit S [Clostridioides sp. ES-S-0048-02]|uniref:restriction endonuclease subunit S n=1 Tax=Clostridioides sp. ES-S-0048-02 TaxID=2770777 RepID=UPI001D120FAE|nr:restriction endonuclease subunit S [Clostridioides sp. ES-S-0048-02]
MKRRAIKEFVTFVPGINQTRAQKQFGLEEVNYYDQQSFEADYKHIEVYVENDIKLLLINDLSLNEGDVVINNSLQLATMVGKNNVGKVLPINFTKVEINNKQLDKRYFLFMFNVYKDVKRQKERELQGMGSVLKIPLRALGDITIPIVPLEEQKNIGKIYIETIKLQSKLNKYSDLIEQFTNSIIEGTLKERMIK